jgi:hypothetical protein
MKTANKAILIMQICIISLINGQFDYSPQGQPNWCGTCSTGKQQSPIDFSSSIPYKSGNAVLKIVDINANTSIGSELLIMLMDLDSHRRIQQQLSKF